jgi:hypothetical protein
MRATTYSIATSYYPPGVHSPTYPPPTVASPLADSQSHFTQPPPPFLHRGPHWRASSQYSKRISGRSADDDDEAYAEDVPDYRSEASEEANVVSPLSSPPQSRPPRPRRSSIAKTADWGGLDSSAIEWRASEGNGGKAVDFDLPEDVVDEVDEFDGRIVLPRITRRTNALAGTSRGASNIQAFNARSSNSSSLLHPYVSLYLSITVSCA